MRTAFFILIISIFSSITNAADSCTSELIGKCRGSDGSRWTDTYRCSVSCPHDDQVAICGDAQINRDHTECGTLVPAYCHCNPMRGDSEFEYENHDQD